jgi:ElaB/YqjD/DUF883 family membrane-anchored ribosome-binding protein
MNTSTTNTLRSGAEQAVDNLASKADQTLSDAEKAASTTAQMLRNGVEKARVSGGEKLDAAAAKLDDVAKRGLDRTLRAASSVRDAYVRSTDEATTYIKEQPLKSVVIAGAIGAALTLLVASLNRRSTR